MRLAVAAFAVACVLGGCATKPLSADEQARVNTLSAGLKAQAAPSGILKVSDVRGADAAKTRLVSVGWAGGFSCFVGLSQLGDGMFAADRIARLDNALVEAFPARVAGQTLVVKRYDIYINRGAEADNASMNAALGGGLLAAALSSPSIKEEQVWRHPKCGPDRMVSGWFDPADLTNNNPPLTLDLQVTVFGKDYTINAAQSPELDLTRLGVDQLDKSPAFSVMLQHLMDKAQARLIASIQPTQQVVASAGITFSRR